MREPTRSEKILLSIFGLMVLGFVLIVGWQTLQRSLFSHRQNEATLREQLVELQRWQAEAPTWQARAEWLAGNPAPVWEREQSEAAFVEELQRSFADHGLTIMSQRLAGTTNLGDFQEISVQMTIRGSTENIVRWLHQVQQPGEFLTVRQLTIRADADKENLRAEITAVRHLSTSASEPAAALPSPESPHDSPAPTPEPPGLPDLAGESEPLSPTSALPESAPLPSAQEPAPPQLTAPALPTPDPQPPPGDDSGNEPDPLEGVPSPVLPFDDVFDPNSPSDDPVAVPPEEVFDLLPTPPVP